MTAIVREPPRPPERAGSPGAAAGGAAGQGPGGPSRPPPSCGCGWPTWPVAGRRHGRTTSTPRPSSRRTAVEAEAPMSQGIGRWTSRCRGRSSRPADRSCRARSAPAGPTWWSSRSPTPSEVPSPGPTGAVADRPTPPTPDAGAHRSPAPTEPARRSRPARPTRAGIPPGPSDPARAGPPDARPRARPDRAGPAARAVGADPPWPTAAAWLGRRVGPAAGRPAAASGGPWLVAGGGGAGRGRPGRRPPGRAGRRRGRHR